MRWVTMDEQRRPGWFLCMHSEDHVCYCEGAKDWYAFFVLIAQDGRFACGFENISDIPFYELTPLPRGLSEAEAKAAAETIARLTYKE